MEKTIKPKAFVTIGFRTKKAAKFFYKKSLNNPLMEACLGEYSESHPSQERDKLSEVRGYIEEMMCMCSDMALDTIEDGEEWDFENEDGCLRCAALAVLLAR